VSTDGSIQIVNLPNPAHKMDKNQPLIETKIDPVCEAACAVVTEDSRVFMCSSFGLALAIDFTV
jgi:hypothetical protein